MALIDDLIAFVRGSGDLGSRDALARRLFEDQCEAIPEYGRYARTYEGTTGIGIPAVAESVYKGRGPRRRLPVARTFRSSATSGQPVTVVELSEAGKALMDAAILESAKRHLRPGARSNRFFLLLPDPRDAPESIMVYGMNLIANALGDGPPVSFVVCGVLEQFLLCRALEVSTAERAPVTLAGGSFTLVRFLDECVNLGWKVRLPLGSQVLDAGGFKGRSREVTPRWLRTEVSRVLGVPQADQVNLLGMTELASQIYDSAEEHEGRDVPDGARIKVNDPWTATTVVDPRTGMPTERMGMLRHVDLAIYDRPCALVTADIGIRARDGFCFVRRSGSVGRRGCSLLVEELVGGTGRCS